MHSGQVDVAPQRLLSEIRAQFPGLGELALRQLRSAGTVVAPSRLGNDLVVRLPLVPDGSDAARAALSANGEEARFLGANLPLEVSQLVAVGEPFEGYPGLWSVWTWVEGESLDRARDVDRALLAVDLAELLTAFHELPSRLEGWGGEARGSSQLQDTDWVRTSIQHCAHLIDPALTTAIWELALAAPSYQGRPGPIHGDPMPGNLVLREGRLAGLIDIGGPHAGDPASDLAPAWTMFDEPERTIFRAVMNLDGANLDDDAWERGRGWAFEMAIGGLHYYEHTNLAFAALARRTLDRLLAD